MYMDKRVLAVVTARGGSKGLLRKNIRQIAGKPLMAWTLDEARRSAYIDRCIVSTDDAEIAELARQSGADVPFLRPAELASDTAKTVDVLMHAMNWLKDRGEVYEIIVLLQPTSPLRTYEDIDKAIELLSAKGASAIVSVAETRHNPCWTNTLPADGSMKEFLRPDVLGKNRQELPVFYRLNGAVYAGYSEYIKSVNGFFGNGTFAYIMPKERSVDIDDEFDFHVAEIMLSDKRRGL